MQTKFRYFTHHTYIIHSVFTLLLVDLEREVLLPQKLQSYKIQRTAHHRPNCFSPLDTASFSGLDILKNKISVIQGKSDRVTDIPLIGAHGLKSLADPVG